MSKVFIGGSRKIGRLNDEIRARIDSIVGKGLAVVIGDADGSDHAVQSYLAKTNYSNVEVYCSGPTCRNNVGDWPTQHVETGPGLTGRKFYTVKDEAMTEVADFGFMLWDGISKGTLNNIERLLSRGKKVLVYRAPQRRFVVLDSETALSSFMMPVSNPREKTSSQQFEFNFEQA